jgi:hypothetical protein
MSCDTLLKAGQTASGYYFVDGPEINSVEQYELVKCNMAKEPSDLSFQRSTGVYINKHIPLPVAFDFQRYAEYSSANSVIPFERALTNNGSSMTTAGVFTAPVRGLYQFSFTYNTFANDRFHGWFSIRVDNRDVAQVLGTPGYESVSEVVVLALNANQKVHVYLRSGGAWGGGDSDTHFTGHMLFRL